MRFTSAMKAARWRRAALGDPGGDRVPLLVDGVARRQPGAKLAGPLGVQVRILPANVGEGREVERPPQGDPSQITPVMPDEARGVGTGLGEIPCDRWCQREPLRKRELLGCARRPRGPENSGNACKALFEVR